MAKKPVFKKPSKDEAEKAVQSGEAQVPAESVESSKPKSDFQDHPKFAKFKTNQGAE
jgi:hypothetical protein